MVGVAGGIYGGEDRGLGRAELAADDIEPRGPRILVGVELAVAAVVDTRELDHPPLRQRRANAGGPTGVGVEIAADGDGPGTLPPEVARLADREDGRQRQHLVVDRQTVADRPAAPGQERAHGVVAAEGRGAGGEVEVRLVLKIDPQGPGLLRGPGSSRGGAGRVGRRPKRADGFPGGWGEELAPPPSTPVCW